MILVAAPLAAHIPLASLAAILMFVAWNMGEWREFIHLRQYRMPYRVTLLAVFFLTVVFDLTVAVEVGLVAACVTFIYRISSLSRSETVTAADRPCWPVRRAGCRCAACTARCSSARSSWSRRLKTICPARCWWSTSRT